MEQNREERIEHYCNRLKLNNMDKKDLQGFFRYAAILKKEEEKGNYTFNGFFEEKQQYDKYSYRITAAGLFEIKQRFLEYLILEKKLFNSYKEKNPSINDNEIWQKIYQEIDLGIDEDLYHARKIAKESSGCAPIILFSLTLVLIISVICLNIS